MSIVEERADSVQRLLLTGIDWKTYGRLLRAFCNQRRIRLTYDRGSLEIMSPLLEHEADADFLGRLIVAMTEELGLPIKSGGSVTLRRRPRRRGLEPDRCYWIAHEPEIRGKRTLNLRTDPPPDLAIEVDLTHHSIDRQPIYAALGVPELWRIDDEELSFYYLVGAKYELRTDSPTFPGITPSDLVGFLRRRTTQDDNSVVAEFRRWFRKRKTK